MTAGEFSREWPDEGGEPPYILESSELDLVRLYASRSAAASVRAELPGEFSAGHEADVADYVAGRLSARELYRRAVARRTAR